MKSICMRFFYLLAVTLMINNRVNAESFVYWTESSGDTAKIRKGSLNIALPAELLSASGFANGLEQFGDYFYWAESFFPDIRIRRVKLDGTEFTTFITTTTGAFDIDIAGGFIYWTEQGPNRIRRANLDGSNVITFIDFTQSGYTNFSPYALKVTDDYVYWVIFDPNNGNSPLKRAKLSDKLEEEYLPNVGIYDIEISSNYLYVFGTGLSSVIIDRIQLSDVNKTRENVVTIDNLSSPTPNSLLVTETHLYWSEAGTRKIRQVNLATKEVKDLFTIVNELKGLAAPVVSSQPLISIYWLEAGSTSSTVKLIKGSLTNPSPVDLVISPEVKGANGLELIDNDLYWPDQQLSAVRKIDRDAVTSAITLQSGINPYDVDVLNTQAYWTELNNNRIRRKNSDGSGSFTNVINTSSPFAIKVTSQFIYWSSFFQNKVFRANLDANGDIVPDTTKELVSNVSVRDMVVTANHIYMTNDFYEAANPGGKITRVDLDTGVTPVLNKNKVHLITGLSFPNSLDINANYMFWSDFITGTINRASLDGSQPTILYSGLSSPRGVAVFADAAAPPTITQQPIAKTVTIRPDDLSKAALADRRLVFTPDNGAATFPFATTYGITLHAADNTYALFVGNNSLPSFIGHYLFRPDQNDPPEFAAAIGLQPFFPDQEAAFIGLRDDGSYGLFDSSDQLIQSGDYNVAPPPPVTATFSVNATGEPTPTYQWQFKASGGGSFSDINDATSNTLTISPVESTDAGEYRVVVSNGNAPDAISDAVSLTVDIYAVDYVLLASAVGCGTVSLEFARSSTTLNIAATSANTNRFEFAGWSGDVPDDDRNNNPLSLTMDQDREVIARFQVIVPNDWIQLHFSGGTPSLDEDADNDGFTSREEYELGSDPKNNTTDTDNVPIRSGWNLIALPNLPAHGQSIDELFSAQSLKQEWWYDSWNQKNTTGGQAVDKQGYWLYFPRTTSPTNVPINGQVVPDHSIFLNPGWNMVGVIVEENKPVNGNILGPIWYWDAAKQRMKPLSANEKLLPGIGYWINVSTATTLFGA